MTDPQVQSPLSEDYLLRREESHLELERPESTFLQFFKQSLVYASPYCTDPACCAFIDHTPDGLLGTASRALPNQPPDEALYYPLALFENLQELPPSAVVRNLARRYHDRFPCSAPFIARVSSLTDNHSDQTFHILLSKALLGAATSEEPDLRSLTQVLWRACVSLCNGLVEIDNGQGRSLEYLAASTLVVAFGCMQADVDVWGQTDITSGYVQATLYRTDLLGKSNPRSGRLEPQPEAFQVQASALRSFYLLVDTLRSIHYHTPALADPIWTIELGPESEHDLRSLCEDLVQSRHDLPPGLSLGDLLLVLVSILSDINTLLCSLGPLTTPFRKVRDRLESLGDERQRHHLITDASFPSPSHSPSESTALRLDYNPYVPCTIDSEYDRLRRGLRRALDTLESSLRSRPADFDGDTNVSSSTCLTLLHLSRLFLEAGPVIHIVPSLAGYESMHHQAIPPHIPRPCLPHMAGIHFDDHILKVAIEILDSTDAENKAQQSQHGQSTQGTHAEKFCPMWSPLALFYGALAVWARLSDEARTESAHAVTIPLRKLLHMFHTELDNLKNDWDCARKMADVVGTLLL
ncbi:hypothetical protein AYO22_03477 [Fonsecaea multimorphosa]|nr:hypothetical protein AYO22_03477 [Fonsecaea multimorphosa]